MTKREKSLIFPTLKVNPKKDDENAIKFKEPMQISIEEVNDVDTKHGEKIVLTIMANNGKKLNAFLNAASKNNLIDAFGDDDERWKGQICDLKKEIDKHFGNEMIVFYPLKK